jgi:transcriptional regulator with XRE-family HTH domain
VKGIDADHARSELSMMTGISESEIRSLEAGTMPTSLQIHKLLDALGWSILFLFGVSENAYLQAEQVFFNDLEVSSPTPDDRRAFQEFYEEFLRIVTEEAGRKPT